MPTWSWECCHISKDSNEGTGTMRKSIEYRDHEIAAGMTILWHGEALCVREVIYRRGLWYPQERA